MNVHFIAIGGSAMHNLAIALAKKGYKVTGSDDEIFEPAKSHLQQYGILPSEIGWYTERITTDLDAVVLGMHAKADNPELLEAQKRGLKIFSYPEFLYEQSKEKTRVVIGGSHGKTTITAMILHALKDAGIDTDYMVGAQLEGFDVMVRLSENAKFMLIEGDEYLTSPLDPRSKFHLYRPHIAVISGIEWDHVNVFPTFEKYMDTFAKFVGLIEPQGKLIYCAEDGNVCKTVVDAAHNDIERIPYRTPAYHRQEDGLQVVETPSHKQHPLRIFGHHNMLNLMAAWNVCKLMGLDEEQFFKAMETFNGASKRLELVKSGKSNAFYKDFAHAPSKVRATVAAMKEEYPDRSLVACLELHTFSSLTGNFLSQYAGSMDKAEWPFVYFNPHALELKRLPPLNLQQVRDAFKNPAIETFNDSKALETRLRNLFPAENQNILMMSSGDFDGLDLKCLADELF
ncbi:MAG: Mur ligase family protein [Bacteroidales bacterium]|nr:Mur ligase family protein [Bacteroidales bacterium]